MGLTPLVDLVAAHFEGWELPSTDEAVLGTADPVRIASLVEEFCDSRLGSRVKGGLFYTSSVGCVAGMELQDGRHLVIKAYQHRWTAPFLEAVSHVQNHLAAAGFPCPAVVAQAEPLGIDLANVERLIFDPGARALNLPGDMKASAAGLAWQVALCRDLDEPGLDQHPQTKGSDELYPQPHSPFLDFSVETEKVAWVDDLARQALAVCRADPSPATIAHTDWSARNLRIVDGRLAATYDWDSIAMIPESVAVGQAGAAWNSSGDAGDPAVPTPEQVLAYVFAYEEAAGYRFAPGQCRAALAGALGALCYVARCEHSIEATTGIAGDRVRGRLAADGRRYLA